MRLQIFALIVLLSGCLSHNIACTMEVKVCPDGSTVGRIAPDCDFAPCPNCGNTGIYGVVKVGPTCPVQQVNNPCPDQPLSIALVAKPSAYSGSDYPFTSSADGSYSLALPQGHYIIQKAADTVYPSLAPVPVTVECGLKEVNITLDSGIR